MNIVLNERSFITYGPYISPFLFNKKDLFFLQVRVMEKKKYSIC